MRCATAPLLAPAAAVVVALWCTAPALAASRKPPEPPRRPIVGEAGPIADASDLAGGGFRRVTFSPDGDGRNDAVAIRVHVTPGDQLSLLVRPISRRSVFVPLQPAKRELTTVVWNGLQPDGTRYPDGSYILHVCDLTKHLCSSGRVLAHLRVITMFARRATGVSAGAVIRVNIATDRLGPYILDLVSVADVAGTGIGAVAVSQPGWVNYRIPSVPYGGLWLLRVRSGTAGANFPLVVHEPTLPLDDPPPHTALVVYPWLTWRAYDMYDENRDGQVDSWYAHPTDPVVPLYGPFEPATDQPLLEGREPNPDSQAAFAQWMLEHKLTAQHVTDVELGQMPASVLRKYALVVFEGHTEYYERATYDKLLSYRNNGGRLYFLQGNSFYGEAQIRGWSVTRLSYRFRTAARSDFALAVTGFRSCCWPATIQPVYHLEPGAVEALPWAFAGTGLTDGDPFGLAAGEVDTVDARLSPPGTVTVATARVPPFTPTSGTLEKPDAWLGTTPIPYEPAWKRPRQIAIAYAATGKGEVFSWGNTGFLKTVVFGAPGLSTDQRAALDRVALNIWEHFAR
jgi:N,N-dimethylformamidase beta subunit-like, C-terminal